MSFLVRDCYDILIDNWWFSVKFYIINFLWFGIFSNQQEKIECWVDENNQQNVKCGYIFFFFFPSPICVLFRSTIAFSSYSFSASFHFKLHSQYLLIKFLSQLNLFCCHLCIYFCILYFVFSVALYDDDIIYFVFIKFSYFLFGIAKELKHFKVKRFIFDQMIAVKIKNLKLVCTFKERKIFINLLCQ